MLAQEQMKQEAATAEFFDGVGVPLSNYTDRVKALTEAFMNSNNQITIGIRKSKTITNR